MREIKFRAFIPLLGHEKEYPKTGDMYYWDLNFESHGASLGIKHGTVMQYTGLKDKNGKEIYEGDIVEFTAFDCFDNDTQYKGCIVWAGTRFMIWSKPDYEFYGSDGGFDLDWAELQDDEFEVIGNIYENKELLKD